MELRQYKVQKRSGSKKIKLVCIMPENFKKMTQLDQNTCRPNYVRNRLD